MASVGIRCGGAGSSCSFRGRIGTTNGRARPCSLVIYNYARTHTENGAVSISRDPRRYGPKSSSFEIDGGRDGKRESRAVVEQRLDEWVDITLAEIVKRLPDAPLFVNVYERDRDDGRRSLDLSIKMSVGEDHWDIMRAKWEKGESSLPEGVIFVEELTGDEDYSGGARHNDNSNKTTQLWGIIVQGKGADCGVPACYLLKTSRVSSGLGFCATHYFLTKVQSFHESAMTQLRNCWLVNCRGSDSSTGIRSEPLVLSGICEYAN